MVMKKVAFAVTVLLLCLAQSSQSTAADPGLNRGSFPKGFVFGTASSAYQTATPPSPSERKSGSRRNLAISPASNTPASPRCRYSPRRQAKAKALVSNKNEKENDGGGDEHRGSIWRIRGAEVVAPAFGRGGQAVAARRRQGGALSRGFSIMLRRMMAGTLVLTTLFLFSSHIMCSPIRSTLASSRMAATPAHPTPRSPSTSSSRRGGRPRQPWESRPTPTPNAPAGRTPPQFEGAVKEDGRGPSVWDAYAHTSGKILDFSNADVAVDQYHRFPEDVQLMADMGMDAYRFSISWSRIYPNGSGAVNQAGIDHYNKLINALLAKGIQPYVTLYHWDLPQALEDKYKGWLDRQIINDFTNYAETCFKEFGDRVKHWITFNEPHTFSIQGYDVGLHAPGRCSILLHLFCRGGNSATEPYIVAHNVLLSHATAAYIYRTKYKAAQKGSVGMSFDVMWFVPETNTPEDIEATQRAQDFQLGWFMDPLFFGDYPSSMRTRVGDRLPKFTAPEAALVKGSMDFVGINHYTTYYARNNKTNIIGVLFNDAFSDSGAITLPFKGLNPIGDKAGSIWLYIVPDGMRSLMNYIKNKYGNPPVIITENGMDDTNNPLIPLKDALKDDKRVKYHSSYLSSLAASIRQDGCDVRGYFVWSLLDNWEWSAGYTSRFGLYFVDYGDKLKRYPKSSVQWFKTFLAST